MRQVTKYGLIAVAFILSGSVYGNADILRSEGLTGEEWIHEDDLVDYSDDKIDPGYGPLDSNEDNYWEYDELLLNGKKVKNTKKHPASAVVYVRGSDKMFDRGWRCSGFLVGHKTVVTAAHCLLDRYSDQRTVKNETIRIYPGKNGSKEPFGHCKVEDSYIPPKWKNGGDSDYDYALLALDCNIGKKTGRLGYAHLNSLKDRKVRLNTYSSGNGKEQWRYSSKIEKVKDRRIRYEYTGSGHGGSSGSAVYIPNEDDCGACAVGVHSGGIRGEDLEKAVRINSKVFDKIRWWKKQNKDKG